MTCGGTLLSYRTPVIFLQLFHPQCVLVYFCTHVTIALQGASQIFEFGDLWQLGRLHLNGVPFRHMYSVFALDTFIPLFSQASIHCSSSNSSTSFSLAHSTTSSANIICQCASFLMFSVSESITMANRKWLKADPWWKPTSAAKGSLVPACSTPRDSFTLMVHVLHQSDVYTSGTPFVSHAPIQFVTLDSVVRMIFSISMNTQCKS